MNPFSVECTALFVGALLAWGWLLWETVRAVFVIVDAVVPARVRVRASRIAWRGLAVAVLAAADLMAGAADYRLMVASLLLPFVAAGAACARLVVADVRRARASRRREVDEFEDYGIGPSLPALRPVSLAEAARLAGARSGHGRAVPYRQPVG